MHGLINRALQGFVTDTYGQAVWDEVHSQAGLPDEAFEAMLHYPDRMTGETLAAAAAVLHRDAGGLLEDLGAYLVTHERMEPIRRLLRFGGTGFLDLLQSLEDLPGRARLAVPDLEIPDLSLRQPAAHRFELAVSWPLPGAGAVLLGMLRALADDYGALVLLEPESDEGGVERIGIELLDPRFAAGRDFTLGGVPA